MGNEQKETMIEEFCKKESYKLSIQDKFYPNLKVVEQRQVQFLFVPVATSMELLDDPSLLRALKYSRKESYALFEWSNLNLEEYLTLNYKKRNKEEFIFLFITIIKACLALASLSNGCLNICLCNFRIYVSFEEQCCEIKLKMVPPCIAKFYKNNSKNKEKCVHQNGLLSETKILGLTLMKLASFFVEESIHSLDVICKMFGKTVFTIFHLLFSEASWNAVKIAFEPFDKIESNHGYYLKESTKKRRENYLNDIKDEKKINQSTRSFSPLSLKEQFNTKTTSHLYCSQEKFFCSVKSHKKEATSEIVFSKNKELIENELKEINQELSSIELENFFEINSSKLSYEEAFKNNYTYEGEYCNSEREGFGKLFFSSGRLAYEGQFHKDKLHYYGRIFSQYPLYFDEFNYKDFRSLDRDFNSKSLWKYYEGEICFNRRHGKGLIVFENGEQYEGEFEEGNVHGIGIFTGKKVVIKGLWNKGLFICSFEKCS